jgi:hypothetical protein
MVSKGSMLADYVCIPSVLGKNIPTAGFGMTLAETALAGHKKKKANFLNEDFYLPLYLPLWFSVSISARHTKGLMRMSNRYEDKGRGPPFNSALSVRSHKILLLLFKLFIQVFTV